MTSHESPPRLVTADSGTPSSWASSSMQWVAQKPPWQRPMPARVRNFRPSTVVAPRSMASHTSPSVTNSQRHTMWR